MNLLVNFSAVLRVVDFTDKDMETCDELRRMVKDEQFKNDLQNLVEDYIGRGENHTSRTDIEYIPAFTIMHQ